MLHKNKACFIGQKVKMQQHSKFVFCSSMTDGTPLVNIRKTLSRLKQEVVNMDVRIGVVEHTLLQARMKDKSNMQRDMHSMHHLQSDDYYH